ncbi:MAG: transglutaminase family protein [Geodermatophilaceae bacterium]|nr:transglutaminase family protein [Geodermatophilaceae bacterium]
MGEVRQVRVGCEFRYDAAIETPAVFQIQAYEGGPATLIRHSWETEPELSRHAYTDLYGNGCQRLDLPAGHSTVRYDAVVSVPDATEEVDLDAPELAVSDLPDEVLHYTLPSRYVLPDVIGGDVWERFGAVTPGYRRVQAIVDHVNGHLEFRHGSSTPLTTAADVHESGLGVCRDYAHLAITFCRALNIPARYVFGYMPDIEVEPLDAEMDFAAWMEVYLGDRWWTFDPRNNRTRKGRILIGRGRDALDVAMVTTYGAPLLTGMKVWSDEVEDAG